MQLKILIADDEKEARELLHFYLQHWKNITVQECSNGKMTLDALESFHPDILFLDIKMPELTGIEVMQQKSESLKPAVIFTTAFDEFAIPAFDFEAVDYLLKPFEKERFDRAMKRAIDYVQFSSATTPHAFLSHLPVKTGNRTDLIPLTDILYFQADGAYVQAVGPEKTHLISEPIYQLETELDPSEFIRIHRSVIVNTKSVQSVRSLLNGDYTVLLHNGRELRASRTYREKIKRLTRM